MITVGVIDIDSTSEKAISIFIVIILSGTFAYSISTIGIILQERNKIKLDLKLIYFNFKS